MKKLSDELNVNQVNERLAKVSGLGFDLPEGTAMKIGGGNTMLDPKELRVEETNRLVESIVGKGAFGEPLTEEDETEVEDDK